MKRIFIMLLIACSAITTMSADPSAAPQKKPELVILTLNAITQKFGQNEGQVYSVNRNPNTNIIESSIKIVPFRCSTNHIKNDNVLNAVAINFPKNEPLAYQFLHIQPGSNEMFSLKVITNNGTSPTQSTQRIRTNRNQEMWFMCCKNPENPQLRDAYAIVWESDGADVDGTVYMISSLRPDIYAKNLETSKNTFKIEGRVDANIKDSLYNIYIADSGEELANIGDDDYVACVPVVNKRFEYQTELDHPVAGRLRCIFPDGELCSAWINLDFVPGETYRITVHNGYYDEDRDYEQRVGRYSGKSLLTERQKRGNDDVVVSVDTLFVDTIPDYVPEAQRSMLEPTPQWQELLKIKLESKIMTIKTGMESIKATYMSLKPYYETGNFSVMGKTTAQIAKQNETLDANFQDLIKTLKKSPEMPQKEKVEVISEGYKEILKFYTEQNQGFTEITKGLGYLPKEFQKLQKVINKLIEKNMNEMSKMMTEMN